jgi:hypothetical protein
MQFFSLSAREICEDFALAGLPAPEDVCAAFLGVCFGFFVVPPSFSKLCLLCFPRFLEGEEDPSEVPRLSFGLVGEESSLRFRLLPADLSESDDFPPDDLLRFARRLSAPLLGDCDLPRLRFPS